MKPLRNQCALILLREKEVKMGTRQWPVVACYDTIIPGGYDKAETQYRSLQGEKALLVWRLEEGLHLCRINADECCFTNTMNTILLPFLSLPAHYRSGMHLPIIQAVNDFIKNKT